MEVRVSWPMRGVAVGLAIAFTAPALGPGVASAASLKPLVVQASDVSSVYGKGFRALSSRALKPSDLAGTANIGPSSAALMKGFVGGYFSSYYRPTATSGVSIVTSGVSLYKNSAYPRAALDLTMKNKASTLKTLAKEHITHVQIGWGGGVGEKALALAYSVRVPAITKGSKATTTAAMVLIFSRGKYAASLAISAKDSLSKGQALAMARRVDDHIQHSG